jgi:hypothetical protein
MVLRKVPFINGSSNRITPRARVSITSSSLVLDGATGANVARACSVNGPNRDTSVKLRTGWYSVTSMLPSTRRPRSVRTSRAVVPTPIGPRRGLGDGGNRRIPLGVVLEVLGRHEPEHFRRRALDDLGC